MIAKALRACWFGFSVLLVMAMFLLAGCRSDSSSRRDGDGGGSCCGS